MFILQAKLLVLIQKRREGGFRRLKILCALLEQNLTSDIANLEPIRTKSKATSVVVCTITQNIAEEESIE